MRDRLPFDSPVVDYEEQAARLLADFRAGNEEGVRFMKSHARRFRDPEVKWIVRDVSDEEASAAPLDLTDARDAVADWYNFEDWPALARFAGAVTADPAIRRFEAAVEDIVGGNLDGLRTRLADDPGLVRAHSPRSHQATLLHYLAANGVEGYRQKSPPNAVEIARALLEGGADPDALAEMYGGRFTTLPMLVSSSPPAAAGVQVPLVETLVDYGASIEPRGVGAWTSPLITALVFGFPEAAEALVRRGATVDSLPAAAGLGRVEEARRLLPQADPDSRHRALALATQLGRVEIVRLLLDAGEDPNRLNPKGFHAHGTPLHQAVWYERHDVVRLLVERGARLDIRDTLWKATPLGWAIYGKKSESERYLREHGAEA